MIDVKREREQKEGIQLVGALRGHISGPFFISPLLLEAANLLVIILFVHGVYRKPT